MQVQLIQQLRFGAGNRFDSLIVQATMRGPQSGSTEDRPEVVSRNGDCVAERMTCGLEYPRDR